MEILGKSFENEKDYLDFIVKNESLIISAKKSAIKEADGFSGNVISINKNISTSKAIKNDSGDSNELLVKVIINTTNVIDSHDDLHIKGLWGKSLKENGSKILHLKEHNRTFDAVISRGDDLKAYTKTYSWKELGYDLEGDTEALVFDSLVKSEQNESMFKEYSKGNVTEHSVGMQYVKMVTCINDEDYPVQKENWDKYSEMVANKESLDGRKVFWAITEAKAIEGSAVLMGSNSFTPTISSTKEELNKEEIESAKEVEAYKKWLS